MKRLLSQTEANAVLDIISLLLDCQNKKDFLRIIEKLKYLVNFLHTRYGFFDFNGFNSKTTEYLNLISSYPRQWENRYLEKKYLLYDKVAIKSFLEPGLIYWSKDTTGREDIYWPESSIYKKKIHNIHLQMMDEASSFDLDQGWLYSLQIRQTGERLFLSFAGDRTEKNLRAETILNHILPHIIQTLKRLTFFQTKPYVKLTSRETETLTWLVAGKTAWETSMIMKISSKTVEFHKKNIFKKLDVVNTQQAIAVAFSTGIIKTPELGISGDIFKNACN